MKITCLLIGEDNLLIQCAALLLEKKHIIKQVISKTKSIQLWCDNNNIKWVESFHHYASDNTNIVDYIFSIVNSKILTPKNLRLAQYGAINYHDSPLPKYAGLNATTWAILNNEKLHGVTWHFINDGIDDGDIVWQKQFAICDKETALTLNLRCFEEAINGFSEILHSIETMSISRIVQNKNNRTYYGMNHIMPDLGFINWRTASAAYIDRFYRAVTLGHYNNNVGSLKLYLPNSYLIISDVEISPSRDQSKESGVVLKIDDDGILISTTSQPVLIKALSSVQGNILKIKDISERHGLYVGCKLPNISDSVMENGRSLYENALSHEKYYLHQLKSITEHDIFSNCAIDKAKKYQTLSLVSTKSSIKKYSESYLVTSILIYLYRLNNYENTMVFINPHQMNKNISQFSGLFCDYLPVLAKISDGLNCEQAMSIVSQQLDSIYNQEGYLSDIFIRHPELELLADVKVITISFFGEKIKPPKNSLLHFEINRNLNQLRIYHRLDCNYHGGSLEQIISNMPNHLNKIIQTLFTHPEALINQLCFLTDEEKNKLLTWGVGEQKLLPGHSIIELFEQQVRKNPLNSAIYHNDTHITYQQLFDKSERVALYIQSLDLLPQTPIGIYIDRSVEMIVLVIGILKANCIYVPLETKYPILKTELIIKEANLSHLFSTGENYERLKIHFSEHPIPRLHDSQQLSISEGIFKKSKNIDARPDKDKIAYILFTSGTTGTPKGVMVTHQNVINYCYWFTQSTNFNKKSIIDFSSSLAFDLSIPCTIAPLLTGGALAICDDSQKINPKYYLSHLSKHRVTHTELTPGYLEMLLYYPDNIRELSDLAYLLLGADVVHTEEVKRWINLLPNCFVINEYGPTETTVSSTSYLVFDPKVLEITVPIGRPGYNTTCYILDKNLNLCPIGMKGELYIGGAQVTRGYLNNPDLTAQKFLEMSPANIHEVIYKTGDLAYWLSEGYIQFSGRNDHQVKIHGYRIELPAIESILIKLDTINQAVVVIKQEKSKEKYLRAYLVSDDKSLTVESIKQFLNAHLPIYMHPKEYCLVKSIPLKENEKIDFDRLEKQSHQKLIVDHESTAHDLTKTEKVCYDIWSKIFHRKAISHDDDFFEIGGDSLIALQIISALKKLYKADIHLSILFEYPTISKLATEIDRLVNNKSPINHIRPSKSIIQLSVGDYEIPLFLIHPVGGSIFWYSELAKKLNCKFTIYGIQDTSINGDDRRFNSLDEMASFYLEEILKIYNGQRYCLGGASFGATLSFAIAQQLIAAGKQIDFLGLFDGWAQYPSSLMKTNSIQLLTHHEDTVSVQTSTDLQQLEEYRKKLLLGYKIPIINTNVTLFKAQELWSSFLSIDDKYNGWRPYVNGNLNIYTSPGTHETMFFLPNVDSLAKQLSFAIDTQQT